MTKCAACGRRTDHPTRLEYIDNFQTSISETRCIACAEAIRDSGYDITHDSGEHRDDDGGILFKDVTGLSEDERADVSDEIEATHDVVYRFKWTIPVQDTDKDEIQIIALGPDSQYRAPSFIADALSVRGFVKDPNSTTTTSTSFFNCPWDSADELIDVLRDMKHVQSVRFESAFEGPYGPPRYYVNIYSGTEEEVIDAVKSYYTGLKIENVKPTSLDVVLSAL